MSLDTLFAVQGTTAWSPHGIAEELVVYGAHEGGIYRGALTDFSGC